ncbi:MAG: 15-cis-phytoene desaturase [Lysobacterales bacterium]|jgi:15-cis-phytoene desaturase
MTKVVVLGGGIGGMSTAHELIERGYEVDVYEFGDLPGGKAKSMYHGSASGPHGRLPAEHGFRFFPGWYKHIDHTMKRIPYPWNPDVKTVFDNLTTVAEVGFARYKYAPMMMLARFPHSLKELEASIKEMFDHPTLNFEPGEMEFYASKLWQLTTSCHARRLSEYEKIGWWDYIDASNKSEDYQKYLGNLPRALVAADPHTVSTKTNGDVLMQMIFDMGNPFASADRVLMGPTNEMWIFAWLKYLIDKGVKYYINAEVTEILTDDKGVSGARIVQSRNPIIDTDNPDANYDISRVLDLTRYKITEVEKLTDKSFTASGDYYVSAMPIEVFAPMTGTANTADICAGKNNASGLMKLDPALETLPKLADCVDWMSGMLMYLKKGAMSMKGHTIYVDPGTALTSIFQKQYWPNIDMSKYGDGETADILSMDISDWTKCKGKLGTTLDKYPDREAVKAEVWEDVIESFQHAEQPMKDSDKHDWFLDPAIEPITDPMPGGNTFTNRTPLLVNLVNSWSLRPEAHTRVKNLFLASDYVRTYTDLATMEGANEAARRAVNSILDVDGSNAPLCKIWNLHEPDILAPMRWWDKQRFAKGLPYTPALPKFSRFFGRIYHSIGKIFGH